MMTKRAERVVACAYGAGLMVAVAMVPGTASAFRTLADIEGTAAPIVWVEVPRVAIDEDTLAVPSGGTADAELAAAIDVWNAASCSSRVVSAAVSPATANVHIRIAEAGSLRADQAGTTELVLLDMPDGVTAIVGATILLNPELAFASHPSRQSNEFDMRAVLVHELGHVLGLAHVCERDEPGLECAASQETATMYPVYTGATQAQLSGDERQGLCFLYPAPEAASAECDADVACQEGEWCIDGGCYSDMRYGGGCTSGRGCWGGVCAELESGAGVCTYDCADSVDCPEGTACRQVRGQSERRVCAPVAAGASCSVRPGSRRNSSVCHLLFLLFVAVLVRTTRRRRRP